MTRKRRAPPAFKYSPWRHGGWYVKDIRYPCGAVGCVSRNYPDGKWRIVCGPGDATYRTRDAAAHAEMSLAKAMTEDAARATCCK